MTMKKYLFLTAGLSAVSALAYDRDPISIGSRLGDGAFMKATGLSPVEWAAMCNRRTQTGTGAAPRTYGYSESERLTPGQTPNSTEILQSQSQNPLSLGDTSVSAGPSKDANFSATINDTQPAGSLTDNHLYLGSDVSQSYNKDHSSIYTDRSDVSGLGAPASSERGTGSSSSAVIPPIDDQLSSTVPSDLEWASQIKSELTKESSENTSGESFTAENLRDVNIRRSNGMVTLTGSVPTENMKRELETRVQKLSGISSVNNQLRVEPSVDVPANPNKDGLGVYPPNRE